MSLPLIRSALEVALAAMSPSIQTAYQNADFTPVIGTPYQRAYVMLTTPDDIEMTGALYIEQGIFQISLFYPLDTGPAVAEARAELIRSTFYRGASFTSGAVTVHIDRTPEIAPAMAEDDRFMIPVRVRFLAQIQRS